MQVGPWNGMIVYLYTTQPSTPTKQRVTQNLWKAAWTIGAWRCLQSVWMMSGSWLESVWKVYGRWTQPLKYIWLKKWRTHLKCLWPKKWRQPQKFFLPSPTKKYSPPQRMLYEALFYDFSPWQPWKNLWCVQTGNGIQHDEYDICGTTYAHAYRKDNIFMQRFFFEIFLCIGAREQKPRVYFDDVTL